MSEGCAADKFLKFPSAPSTARCPKRSAGTQTAGRLFLAYLILAKQKKVSRPPRRQSGIRTQPSACSLNQEQIRDRAFSGSEHKFPAPLARPSGAALRFAAKLRSDPKNQNWPHSNSFLLTIPQNPPNHIPPKPPRRQEPHLLRPPSRIRRRAVEFEVIGVRHRFRCDAEHRTRRASHRLGEFGL